MAGETLVKPYLFLLICLFCCADIYAQGDPNVHVEDIYLARDNGKGKIGETAEGFFTNDIPIHCVVQLDSLKPVTVTMVFIAVNVSGVKGETKVITTKYKTNGEQNQVYFTGRPDKVWVAGEYRIDIFIDGRPDKSVEFEIRKTSEQTPDTKSPPARPKPRSIKKFKKN